jgi:hypothetical protein
MSKKKFSEGLQDLLNDTHSGQGSFFSATSHPTPADRKPAHKNFMSGLDSLLQEALEESLEKYEANQPGTSPSAKSKSSVQSSAARQAFSGLDALIRQTIDVQEINVDEVSGKKRLTVAVDKTKLEKLKLIARLENSYLKDLLVGLIDEYISAYTQQKGIDL